MNETLRWTLLLGCLLIAGLEVPRTSMLVLEDIEGPYATPASPLEDPSCATVVRGWLATCPRLAALTCPPWIAGGNPLLLLRAGTF